MKFKWPKFCCCLAAATAAAIQKHLNPYFLTELALVMPIVMVRIKFQ